MMDDDPTSAETVLVGPVKRSMTIAGHQSSISLEPIFWRALEASAKSRNLPLSALVAQIDAERVSLDAPPNLASAIRCRLLSEVTLALRDATEGKADHSGL